MRLEERVHYDTHIYGCPAWLYAAVGIIEPDIGPHAPQEGWNLYSRREHPDLTVRAFNSNSL